MTILDKKHVLRSASPETPVDIELGCGPSKRAAQAIGIDMLDYDCVDIVGDALDVIDRFPEASVRSVRSFHFMEHLPDVGKVMQALSRIVIDGGSVQVTVPHFSNPFFYSDPTHKTHFGLYTFSYLCRDALFRRKVPSYGIVPSFSIESVRLGFKSYRPNYLRHAAKLAWGRVVNSSVWITELYEENLCWLVPAYEITYELRRMARRSA